MKHAKSRWRAVDLEDLKRLDAEIAQLKELVSRPVKADGFQQEDLDAAQTALLLKKDAEQKIKELEERRRAMVARLEGK